MRLSIRCEGCRLPEEWVASATQTVADADAATLVLLFSNEFKSVPMRHCLTTLSRTCHVGVVPWTGESMEELRRSLHDPQSATHKAVVKAWCTTMQEEGRPPSMKKPDTLVWLYSTNSRANLNHSGDEHHVSTALREIVDAISLPCAAC